jgi:CheY-like chemotaxis protein
MPEASKDGRADSRPGVLRSLASKYSIFTAILVFWVVATLMAYDLRQDNFDLAKGALLCIVVLLVSGAISRFTIRLLTRPLKMLEAGITSVRNGRLEPIQISRTGDEIEFLGESINSMIEALAASRREIERIQQREEKVEEIAAENHPKETQWQELMPQLRALAGALDGALVNELPSELRRDLEPVRERASELLSLCKEPQDARETEPVQAHKAESDPRILIVEDNIVNQKVVTAVLRKGGFAIEIANDGQEALARLNAGNFDLVLMDVQMPVLDGLEATRQIRKDGRWSNLPIVAMTAHAMSGDKERCLEAGMNGYISKPVHPAHLLATVDEYLRSRALA